MPCTALCGKWLKLPALTLRFGRLVVLAPKNEGGKGTRGLPTYVGRCYSRRTNARPPSPPSPPLSFRPTHPNAFLRPLSGILHSCNNLSASLRGPLRATRSNPSARRWVVVVVTLGNTLQVMEACSRSSHIHNNNLRRACMLAIHNNPWEATLSAGTRIRRSHRFSNSSTPWAGSPGSCQHSSCSTSRSINSKSRYCFGELAAHTWFGWQGGRSASRRLPSISPASRAPSFCGCSPVSMIVSRRSSR